MNNFILKIVMKFLKKYEEKVRKLEMKHKIKEVNEIDPLVRIKSLKK